ncbi:unnamed protein product [Soboliphyme baturini]|uniref:AMP-binding domain-containing protein n=1 Tax=Soboliphyme baturini TaxID=241478 RepID=A0A183IPY4_9BILA|nr:unnamed protein product [Soboliphyme baturini]
MPPCVLCLLICFIHDRSNGGPDIPLAVVPVHQLVLDHLRKHDPEGICMVPWKTYTFRQFLCHTISSANYLHHIGLRKETVVALVLPNCPEFATCLLAIFADGGIATCLSPAFTTGKLQQSFDDPRFSFQFKFLKLCFLFKEIITVDPCDFGAYGDSIRLSEMDFDFGGEQLLASVSFDCKKDLCICPLSSGTTLHPKAVKLSHYNVASMIQSIRLFRAEKITLPVKGFNIICFLPFYHIYGTVIFLVGLLRGFVMITMEEFKSELFLNLIQTYKVMCQFLFVVPPILNFLVRHPLVKKFDISSVKTILVAAAPFGKEESGYLAYGLTEISGASHIMPAVPVSKLRHGSCGVLLPNFECKVRELSGKTRNAMERGEICLRGPACCLGYFGNEGATEQLIDSEGWLHTGDVGYFDEDGYYFIVDRIKDMIKIKGFQVFNISLRNELLHMKHIADAKQFLPDFTAFIPRSDR